MCVRMGLTVHRIEWVCIKCMSDWLPCESTGLLVSVNVCKECVYVIKFCARNNITAVFLYFHNL